MLCLFLTLEFSHMSPIKKYILEVPLSKQDIKTLKRKERLKNLTNVVLETDSLFCFYLLCRFPFLYKIFQLLPQIKKARPEFYELNKLRRSKFSAMNSQKYEMAVSIRDNERILRNTIIQKYPIKSFKMNNFYLKYSNTALCIILINY